MDIHEFASVFLIRCEDRTLTSHQIVDLYVQEYSVTNLTYYKRRDLIDVVRRFRVNKIGLEFVCREFLFMLNGSRLN